MMCESPAQLKLLGQRLVSKYYTMSNTAQLLIRMVLSHGKTCELQLAGLAYVHSDSKVGNIGRDTQRFITETIGQGRCRRH